MIRVLVVDDHPALRAGLATVLRAEPGLVFAGESAGDETLWPVLNSTQPDVVLLDYHLPHLDGLQACYRMKLALVAPKVILYSAYASAELALAAALAGADGLLNKALSARELFNAVREVYGGARLLPPPSRTAVEQAIARLPEEDHPLVGLLLDGSSAADCAEVLGTDPADIQHRIQRMLGRLRLETPVARS